MKQITIELGETVTLSAAEEISALGGSRRAERLKEKIEKEDCRFHFTGGAAVAQSDINDEESVSVIGAQVGKTLVSFGPELARVELTNAQRFGSAFSPEEDQITFEVTVVEKKDEGAKKGSAESPLASSRKFEGLIPMSETQDGPSEATPYGMAQENKPVAPHPSMVGPDDSSVARVSEDAEATGAPDAAEIPAEAREDARDGTTADEA